MIFGMLSMLSYEYDYTKWALGARCAQEDSFIERQGASYAYMA